MRLKLKKEREELQNELKKLGYEDLRMSLFKKEDEERREFQLRIDYQKGCYSVYATGERASRHGGSETFDNFEEAKEEFFQRIEAKINYNRLMVKRGNPPQYPCSIWRSEEGKKKVALEESELLKELEKRGYADLRVSLLRPKGSNLADWQVRINYEHDRYIVYTLGKKGEYHSYIEAFDEFKEGKEKFFELVEEMVSENKKRVKWRRKPRYASVIWDKPQK